MKQKLTTKEISIFGNSSHFEWRAALSDTILKKDHPRTIPAIHSKWLLLPKIEISLVVNFCFITNQNELKF
jgi:hypothetical protein